MEGKISIRLENNGKDQEIWQLYVGCNLPGKWVLHWGVNYVGDMGRFVSYVLFVVPCQIRIDNIKLLVFFFYCFEIYSIELALNAYVETGLSFLYQIMQ